MTVSDNERRTDERFAGAWNQWLQRPLKKQPEQAAREVLLRLEQRRRTRPSLWMPIAAALALAVGGSLVWRSLHPRSAPAPVVTQAPSRLGQDEVLMWLDDRTPLYMTFQTPESPGGKQ
jgi:hypothetical protein